MSHENLVSNFEFDQENTSISKIKGASPKQIGTWIEVFLRKNYGLDKSDDNYYDAICSSGKRIEIKASRVIVDLCKIVNETYLDDFNNSERTISSFKEAKNNDFLCNIQQVKPECFDELNYLLLFKDCILEFRISSKTLLDTVENKKINRAIIRAVKKERSKHPELCKFLDEYLLDKQKLSDIARVCANHHDKMAWKEINDAVFEKRSISFSTKQHKGNKGEGQFHIKKTNLQYHIDNFLVAIYTYDDFKNVLSQCEK